MPETTTTATTPAASATTQPGADASNADTSNAEAEVRRVVEQWAAAVRAGELDGVLAAHTDNVVMFDVPPPEEGVRGLDAYRSTWPQFFEYLRPNGHFDLLELDVTAGDDVAFVWALLRCGSTDVVAAEPDRRLRLTIGLRHEDGEWLISHEHHSFADRD